MEKRTRNDADDAGPLGLMMLAPLAGIISIIGVSFLPLPGF